MIQELFSVSLAYAGRTILHVVQGHHRREWQSGHMPPPRSSLRMALRVQIKQLITASMAVIFRREKSRAARSYVNIWQGM